MAAAKRRQRLEVSDEIKHLCKGASDVLSSLCRDGASSEAPDVFDLQAVPEIALAAYLARISMYLSLTKPQFLLGIEYIERFLAASSAALTSISVHRVVATAMVLAHKFDNDFALDDTTYGKIVGVCSRDLMRLQFAFMKRIDYRLMYPASLRELPL
jgi:hypothetical protein